MPMALGNVKEMRIFMKQIVVSGLLACMLAACSEKPSPQPIIESQSTPEVKMAGEPVIDSVKVIASEPIASTPIVQVKQPDVVKKPSKTIIKKEAVNVPEKTEITQENASESLAEIKPIKHAKIIAKKKEASGVVDDEVQTSLLHVSDGLVVLGRP